MLDLAQLDVDEIAMALEDQTDYDHRWLIDPRTGEIHVWTSETGIDGESPLDLEVTDLLPIDPLPSWVWYRDMADFAEALSSVDAGRRLSRAIQGKGAFRRFKNVLYDAHPELLPAWHAFHDSRAQRRAVEWLLEAGLLDHQAAHAYLAEHPEPRLPLTDLG